MNEFVMNPDREMTEQAFVLALLVKGRTLFDDFTWTDRSRAFAKILEEFGLHYEEKGHQLSLEGLGFQYRIPTYFGTPVSENALVLLFALASRDKETLYTVAGPAEFRALAKSALAKYFCARVTSETADTLVFQFEDKLPVAHLTSLGNVPYLLKESVLLCAFVNGSGAAMEEKTIVRDSWAEMLGYFGASLSVRKDSGEAMDELARRIAKAKGIRTETKIITELSETKILTSCDYFIAGDPTEAAAFATLGSLALFPKETTFTLKNSVVSGNRGGFFPTLKRMNADVEITSRHEKFGTAFGTVEVRPGNKLQARRLSEDIIATCLEEYPFLALAACAAEGETILRIPKENRAEMRSRCENLAVNLRKTGSEVGVYDEGLVIRGRETVLDGGEFDCKNDPVTGLALYVLSLFGQGITTIAGIECVEAAFPGICDKLKSAVTV